MSTGNSKKKDGLAWCRRRDERDSELPIWPIVLCLGKLGKTGGKNAQGGRLNEK